MPTMKHCTKCGRQYYDPLLKYCTEDGTRLTPQFDSEAETVKIAELTAQDVVMELTDYLKRLSVRPGENVLVRFEEVRSVEELKSASLKQIRENIGAAAQQAGLLLVTATDTRATVQKPSSGGARIVRA
jgi:hypothetical protein